MGSCSAAPPPTVGGAPCPAPPAPALLAVAVLAPAPTQAAEEVLFGPARYTTPAGPSQPFRETILLPPTLTAPFRLHVENGNPDGTH
jgi:hypothetical protein